MARIDDLEARALEFNPSATQFVRPLGRPQQTMMEMVREGESKARWATRRRRATEALTVLTAVLILGMLAGIFYQRGEASGFAAAQESAKDAAFAQFCTQFNGVMLEGFCIDARAFIPPTGNPAQRENPNRGEA